MALVYRTFTAARIVQGLRREEALRRSAHAPLVLPGLAASLQEELAQSLNRPVTVGPVCAAELPLFFGEQAWRVSC